MDPHQPMKSASTAPRVAAGLMSDPFSIAVICLVLLGIAGVAYKALAPGGWVSALLDELWRKNPLLVWLVGFGCASLLAAAKWWHDRNAGASRRREAFAYAFMALGLFFFFKLIVTGTL